MNASALVNNVLAAGLIMGHLGCSAVPNLNVEIQSAAGTPEFLNLPTDSVGERILLSPTGTREFALQWQLGNAAEYSFHKDNCQGPLLTGEGSTGKIEASQRITTTITVDDFSEGQVAAYVCVKAEGAVNFTEFQVLVDSQPPTLNLLLDDTEIQSGGLALEEPTSIRIVCDDAQSGNSLCTTIAVTTNGTTPALNAENTLMFASQEATLDLEAGSNEVRYIGIDGAGNRTLYQEKSFPINSDGYTFVGTNNGLGRGIGYVPGRFTGIPSGTLVWNVLADPTRNRIYAAASDGLYISEDEGQTWSHRGSQNGLLLTDIRDVAIDSTGKLYVLAIGTEGTSNPSALSISTDSGNTFSNQTNYPGSEIAVFSQIDVVDGTIFLSGLDAVIVSTDDGNSFAELDADGSDDRIVLSVNPDNANELFVGDALGLKYSDDGGQTFTSFTPGQTGIAGGQVSFLSVDYSQEPYVIYAVAPASSNVQFSTNGGQTFEDGAIEVGSNTISLNIFNGRVYSSSAISTGEGPVPQLYSTNLDGTDLQTYGPGTPGLDTALITSVVAANSGRLFFGSAAGVSYTDDEQTFSTTALGNGLRNPDIKHLRTLGSVLYVNAKKLDIVSGTGGIDISEDGGYTFRHAGIEEGLTDENVRDFEIAQTGPNTDDVLIAVATENGLAISLDNGHSFEMRDESDGLATKTINDVHIAQDGLGNRYIYAATDDGVNGVAVSTDHGQSFTPTASQPLAAPLKITGPTDDPQLFYVATGTSLEVSDDGGTTFGTQVTDFSNWNPASPPDIISYFEDPNFATVDEQHIIYATQEIDGLLGRYSDGSGITALISYNGSVEARGIVVAWDEDTSNYYFYFLLSTGLSVGQTQTISNFSLNRTYESADGLPGIIVNAIAFTE